MVWCTPYAVWRDLLGYAQSHHPLPPAQPHSAVVLPGDDRRHLHAMRAFGTRRRRGGGELLTQAREAARGGSARGCARGAGRAAAREAAREAAGKAAAAGRALCLWLLGSRMALT